MKKVLDRLESNLSGCTLSIIWPKKTTSSNYDGIFQEKSFQLLSELLLFNGKTWSMDWWYSFVVLICIQHIKLFYRKESRQSPRRDIATIQNVIILYCKCNVHSTDACKNIMHESVRYWLIIIGGQLFTGLHDLLMRQEEGGYILCESGKAVLWQATWSTHMYLSKELFVYLSLKVFFGAKFRQIQNFFSVKNGEKLVFVEQLSCQISNNFFLVIKIWGQILPQDAVGSQKYRNILDFF